MLLAWWNYNFKGGVDYGSGPYMITITAGVTVASFNILLIDDNVFENDENFMLTIDSSSLPDNVTVGDPDQVTVTVLHNDGTYALL